MNAPYLRVTIHDNDFTSYWEELGNAILGIIKFECDDFEKKTVEEADLLTIRPYIANIWYGIDALSHHFRWKPNNQQTDRDRKAWFDNGLELSIVDYLDIPDWDNSESIYIPLYAGGDNEIILR